MKKTKLFLSGVLALCMLLTSCVYLTEKNDHMASEGDSTSYTADEATKQEQHESSNKNEDVTSENEKDDTARKIKEQALANAEGYAKQNNFENALNVLEEYRNTYGKTDLDIEAKYLDYTNAYVNFICEKVEALRKEKKYQQALTMLKNASEIVSSPTFDELAKNIENEKPIYLTEVKCQNKDNYEQVAEGTEVEDTLGNKYQYGNLYRIFTHFAHSRYNNGRADYYIGYSYEKLCGFIAVEDSGDNISAKFSILGDGVVLYSIDVTRLTAPVPLEVDVSNVNIVTIKLDSYDQGKLQVLLSDFYFEK